MRPIIIITIIALIAALVLSSEVASGMGMVLVVEGDGDDGLRMPVTGENDWREAHINGAQRLRSIGPVLLPVLLLAAGVLSFISPDEKGTTEEFWDDDCPF